MQARVLADAAGLLMATTTRGQRVRGDFWWPGTVKPAVVTGMGSGLDLLATAASLAGAPMPTDRTVDSIDLTPTLKKSQPSPRHELFYYWDNELRAVRKGNYKAHFITSGAYGEGEPRTTHDPTCVVRSRLGSRRAL